MIRIAHPHATSPLRRSIWALLALMQVMTFGLVPLADAHHGPPSDDAIAVEAAEAGHGVTVEHHDCVGSPDNPCDPVHAHQDCVLCRALSTGAVAPSVQRAQRALPTAVQITLRAGDLRLASSGATSPHPARAPPLA